MYVQPVYTVTHINIFIKIVSNIFIDIFRFDYFANGILFFYKISGLLEKIELRNN